MEIYHAKALECADAAEKSLRFFDTRAPFERWLKAMALPTAEEGINGAGTEGDSISLESYAATNCDVTFAGVLRVDGLLQGNIRSAEGTLVMTEQGRIEADVEVRVALIDGHITGNIRASEFVVLEPHAHVQGNINTPSLAVREGAVFEGHAHTLSRTAAIHPEFSEELASAVGA